MNQRGKKRLLTQQSQTKRLDKSQFCSVEWTAGPVGSSVHYLLLIPAQNRWRLIWYLSGGVNSKFVPVT